MFRVSSIQCITLVVLYGQFMMHGQRNIKLFKRKFRRQRVNLGARWGWVVNATPRTRPPTGKTRYPLFRELGGPQGWSGRVPENLDPTEIWSPDHPSCSISYDIKMKRVPPLTAMENINVCMKRQVSFYWEKTITSIHYVKRHTAAVARSVVWAIRETGPCLGASHIDVPLYSLFPMYEKYTIYLSCLHGTLFPVVSSSFCLTLTFTYSWQ